MKKVICLVLTILTIAALAVPVAAAEKAGANAAKIATTVKGVSASAPKIDGVIGQYEYEEIKYTADDMRYNGTDDAYLAAVQKYNFKMYAAYDAAKMYVAVVVDTPNYSQTKAASSMYLEYSCQVSCAKGDEKTAATRSEYGFGKMSTDGKLIFNAWADAYALKWAPDLTGKDFNVYTKDDKTTYEIAIPAKAFGVDSLKKGEKVRLNICMNVGSDTVGDKKRGQIEWSLGCGNGKDATKFAVVTLGDSIQIPVTTTAEAAAATTAKAAASTTKAAQTADFTGYIAAAMVLSLATAVDRKSVV